MQNIKIENFKKAIIKNSKSLRSTYWLHGPVKKNTSLFWMWTIKEPIKLSGNKANITITENAEIESKVLYL